jgi:uncharacterized protein YcgI (DUF1989 family)
MKQEQGSLPGPEGRSVREEFTIPKCEGRAFRVERGEVLRVISAEGPQAADLIAFRADDLRESLSTWLTRHVSGSFSRATEIYSKLPAANIMFRLLNERPGLLWLSPGRCNVLTYRKAGMTGYHANCQDILTGLIEPYGLTAYDVPEVLNLFMNPVLRADGTYDFLPSPVDAGDSVDLLAEMDCLVGISACPSDAAYNVGVPKALRVEILGKAGD